MWVNVVWRGKAVPSMTPCAAMYIMTVSPEVKMRFWPKLSAESEVCVFRDASW